MRHRDFFFWGTFACAVTVVAFITLPLAQMLAAPSLEALTETILDKDVLNSIVLSLTAAAFAAFISFILGTPLAYLLSRREFRGKRLVEGIIDLPIIIPHPVVGIAILSITGRNHWFGQLLTDLGYALWGALPESLR